LTVLKVATAFPAANATVLMVDPFRARVNVALPAAAVPALAVEPNLLAAPA